MSMATHASLALSRFNEPREIGPVLSDLSQGALFLKVAADIRAAGSNWQTLSAFKFAMYGLHESEDAALQTVQNRQQILPWLDSSMEVWAGVLRPFRHFGEANFLEKDNPGACFVVTDGPPEDDSPIVIVTSVGWASAEGEAMERIKRFGEGVTAVRIGMTGLPGLHSQQSFTFPGGLIDDGLTVTFWRNLRAAMDFAYGPGMHRGQVKIQRSEPYGDRTSFTRFRVLHSEGSWHGSDPLAP
ncbi:MAG TPA: hypothetical protein PKA27_14475 [Fimbriimonadaceae bacterium]|nr:hypothetical protein [Fimbriimonadaceae bacterium]